jgi:hypothetical protein
MTLLGTLRSSTVQPLGNKVYNNPFTNCRPEINAQEQWCVSSDYWAIPCANKKASVRLCEIIQGAYRAGASDLRGEFNSLLREEE